MMIIGCLLKPITTLIQQTILQTYNANKKDSATFALVVAAISIFICVIIVCVTYVYVMRKTTAADKDMSKIGVQSVSSNEICEKVGNAYSKRQLL